MHIRDFSGRSPTVCLLGFGREGQATLKALVQYAPDTRVTIADRDDRVHIAGYECQTGPSYLSHLDLFDVIIKSPGIPPCREIESVRSKLTSATQIFFDSIAETGARVIGVTGSKGKSTTASLIYDILKAAGRDVHLAGNIGTPAIACIHAAKRNTLFVLELSSYQLMDLRASPHIAVVTAFFPEHLDYHGSLAAYEEAKRHIARFQTKEDIVFFNGNSPECQHIASESGGRKTPFGPSDAPVSIDQTALRGEHNLSNIAAAWKVAQFLGIPKEVAVEAIRSFRGLPHRLESLGVHGGIEWIDDAISTTPESTVAALDALGERVRTIILGGQDRGSDFTILAMRIMESTIEHIILIGESGAKIRAAVEKAYSAPALPPPNPKGPGAKREGKRNIRFFEATSMSAAVRSAREHTPTGAICLLSTASPSYDMFENFEEKGRRFSAAIGAGAAALPG